MSKKRGFVKAIFVKWRENENVAQLLFGFSLVVVVSAATLSELILDLKCVSSRRRQPLSEKSKRRT